MTGYEQFKTDPGADGLAVLSQLAVDLNQADLAVARREEDLRKAQQVATDLSERQIPELMDSLGIETFTTTAGLKVTVGRTIRASIPAAQKEQAMAWLDEHGHGGLIKRSVVVAFNREDEAQAKRLAENLQETYGSVKSDQKVESSTLRAFIAERLKLGEDIPLALFGAWEQRKAKVAT